MLRFCQVDKIWACRSHWETENWHLLIAETNLLYDQRWEENGHCKLKINKFKLRFEIFKNSSFELEMILGSLLHLKAQIHVLAHIGNCADNCTHTRPVKRWGVLYPTVNLRFFPASSKLYKMNKQDVWVIHSWIIASIFTVWMLLNHPLTINWPH